MLLCASVATLTASSTALAQARGNSGLPAGSGNPMADLQAQMTVLQQQTTALQQQIGSLSALGQDVTTLKQQLQTLMTLQTQVASLTTQANQQVTSLSALGKDVTALKEQLTMLAAMQSQLTALNAQLTTLSGLQTQVRTLTSQVEALAAQSASNSYVPLAVYDNKDQILGEVVGVDDNVPWVALTAGDYTVVLQVFPQQLIGQNLWFDAANCTGNAYVAGLTLGRGANVFALAAVSEPGGVIYAAHPTERPAKRSAQWSLRDSTGLCTNQGTFSQAVLPASPVFTLDTLFQRPYHVR
jgi:prefoldin subunit 5